MNMRVLNSSALVVIDMGCQFRDANGNAVTFKPDGVHEMSACEYEEIERHTNVTVIILRCKNCGDISIAWQRQENTDADRTD